MEPDDNAIWPDVPRACFGPGEPSRLNACVGWAIGATDQGTRTYVYGYRRAAEALYEHVASCQRMSPDYVLFPLAFLWRHHVELALKEIIATGKVIKDEGSGSPTGHRLRDLWRTAKPYILAYGRQDAPELENVGANIEEFETVDPWATGFRYLLHADGATPALVNPPSTVNLAILQESMIAISNFLDAVHMCQQQALEAMAEAWG